LNTRRGRKNWALEDAYKAQDENGAAAVGFKFDARGATLFGRLTGANIGKQLSVVLDDRVYSAAPRSTARSTGRARSPGGMGIRRKNSSTC
jgi:preprotein translocase subunit SecD